MAGLWTRLRKLYRVINHAQIDYSKRLLLGVFKFLFDQRKKLDVTAPVTSILVFRLDDKLGDSIASTGFFRELHKLFPEAKIKVLSGPTTANVFRQFNYLEVIVAERGFLNTLRTWMEFRGQNFHVLVNTSHILSARVAFLATHISASNKISFLNSDWQCFHHAVFFEEWSEHITVRFKRCLQHLQKVYLGNFEDDAGDRRQDVELNLSYCLPLPQDNQMLIDFKEGHKPYIIINSFAAARPRCFSFETTRNIIQALSAEFPKHRFVSVASSNDQVIVHDWISNAGLKVWEASPVTDFLKNASLIQGADLCISPDTSIVHLSCAVGTKTICVTLLESETQFNVWSPYGVPNVDIPAVLNRSTDLGINTVRIERIVSAAKSLLN